MIPVSLSLQGRYVYRTKFSCVNILFKFVDLATCATIAKFLATLRAVLAIPLCAKVNHPYRTLEHDRKRTHFDEWSCSGCCSEVLDRNRHFITAVIRGVALSTQLLHDTSVVPQVRRSPTASLCPVAVEQSNIQRLTLHSNVSIFRARRSLRYAVQQEQGRSGGHLYDFGSTAPSSTRWARGRVSPI